jgi:hypothetical protein
VTPFLSFAIASNIKQIKINGKEYQMDRKKRITRQMIVATMVVGLLFVVGCASSEKMTSKITGEKILHADKAFSEARDGNASKNAKEALAIAEGKLAKAKEAFAAKNYEEAADLAEQAVVDANYALAKATTQKNLDMAEGIKKETEELRQEIERMPK